MCDEQDHNDQNHQGAEKRVSLPEPDTENITVLTESLPNEPILPWHHFDSPWLNRHPDQDTEQNSQNGDSLDPPPAADDTVQQLSLLEELEQS